MDKLSELSKPVAQIYYDELDSSVMRIGWFRSDEPKNPEPLYSQEYVSALLARIEELEATEIKPEGMRLMSEAIGAHGYIVGCLVQGRPDLALEESRKWVDAFSQAAELINNG
ncbi:hypothetical protein BVG97_16260 [Serratia marcescens]|uniref:hypothetical protein n=1 Tax=Serratia marcescens TaxID=615 RepID=UPI000B6155A9|nr:hypothetical protein [Serratia marcescens]ASL89067.1 hypothetical protein BVG97_16260 [Serratia marcescens]